MANNIFQVKRTSVSGRQPNTTGSYATNSQYIAAGEFALNMTDGILYTSDGTNVITVGANSTKYSVGSNFIVNTTVLSVNSATFYNTNLQQAPSNNFTANSYAALGGAGSNYLAFGQIPSNFGQWIQSGYPSVSSPVYYNIYLNPLGGKVGVGSNTSLTNTFNVTGTSFFSSTVTINQDTLLQFQTVNTSAYAGFKQQSDDNFVFYTTNTAYGQRAVFSIFANSVTSNLAFSVPVVFNATAYLGTAGLSANGSLGSPNQILTSNGSATYWSSPGAASVNTQATYTWSNLHTFNANVTFGGNGISFTTNTGAIYFNGLSDNNWRIGRNAGQLTKTYYTGNTLDVIGYSAVSGLEGIALGQAGANVWIETGYNGTYTKNPIYVGNSVVNVSINSTSFTGTANNTSYVGTVTAANVVSNAQLTANLGNYTTTAGLPAVIAVNTANNTSYVGTVTAANVVSNAQLQANLGNYQTTAGLSANVAVLSSNNSSYLGGVAAASYVNTSGAYTISGIHTHTANLVVNAAIIAGGNSGQAGQVLTSNGSGNVYWSTVTSGSGTVTSVGSANGIAGGPITGSGTLYVVAANSTMYVNASGIAVNTAALPSTGGGAPTMVVVSGTSQAASINNRYVLTNVATTTLTLPASPSAGDTVYVVIANGLATNIVARNGNKIMSLDEDLTLDINYYSIGLMYVNATLGWIII